MNVVEDDVFKLIRKETSACTALHGPMHSGHEGYAVAKEEVEESMEELARVSEALDSLWDGVRGNDPDVAANAAKDAVYHAGLCACELIQVAAVFTRVLEALEVADE